MPSAFGPKRESDQLTAIASANPAQKEAEPIRPCWLGDRPRSSLMDGKRSPTPKFTMDVACCTGTK